MSGAAAVVFLGPTLSAEEAAGLLEATYLGPVRRGDVIQAVLSGAERIAVIDGCFGDMPALTHKEILWAMEQGIEVYGASSLGALRAAELAAFGMVGIGKIFEDFSTGRLTDDDEVAIQHGPAELGYVPTSETMVNMRATVATAKLAGVLGEAADIVLRVAKARHYPERHWPESLADALAAGASAAEIEAFRAWLPCGKVDQKRKDARALLLHMCRRSRKSRDMQTASGTLPLTEDLAALLTGKPIAR